MPDLREQNRRLLARIDVLEARNAKLRSEVERLTHGEQPRWTPFQEASSGVFGDGRIVKEQGCRTYLNSRYQVTRFDDGGGMIHLSIKRTDGAACRDWRDFQRIKNELVGPEAEGAELYPAESRLVDGANQYHLWCTLGQIPVGFGTRLVSDDDTDGVQQRPFDEDQKPNDLTTVSAAAMAKAAGLGE